MFNNNKNAIRLASSSFHQHMNKLIEYMNECMENSIIDLTTCRFCQRIKAFLSENSEREIQQSNSKGTNRVSILFPTFPTRAFSKPCLVLISIDSDICIQKLSISVQDVENVSKYKLKIS